MYATDMIHCTVNVKELAEKNEEKSIRLENEFFKQFGNEDVVGGEVDVVATARKSQDSKYDYLVEIKVKGVLRITCTRCLDEMNYDTEVEDTVKVVCTNADMETDDEDMLEARADGTLDLSHRVFETLALNVPLVHVHEEGECNPAMTKWLESHSAEIQ